MVSAGRRRAGFTLVEMMACVVIIGAMAGGVTLTVQKISRFYERYAATVTLHDMVTLQQALEIHNRLFGRYPAGMDELFKSGVAVGDAASYLGELVLVKSDKDGPVKAGFKDAAGTLYDLPSFIASAGALGNRRGGA